MNWIKFEDGMPEEQESIFAKYYGTNRWLDGVMFRTVRYGLLFTIECNGERAVVNGKMIDGKPKIDDTLRIENIKFVAWTPYPEPFYD